MLTRLWADDRVLRILFFCGVCICWSGARALAVQSVFFDDKAAFDAVATTATVDFEGLAPDNGFWPPPPLIDRQLLTAGGIPFSAPGWIVVNDDTAPYAGTPWPSAILATDTSPITADLSGVAGGVTAVGGFFGNTGVSTNRTTLTLTGTSGVLDQQTFFAPDMGLGQPRAFFGWVIVGDTALSVEHNIMGNFEGLDDFQYGDLDTGLTVVDVLYSDPAAPVGPLSLGLDSLPEEIPAQFILDGTVTGATTFGLSDVLYADLSLGDGSWRTDDLVSFSMSVDALGEVTDLTYELGEITTATAVMRPVLNSSFSLSVSGTDIASGLDFDYLHQNSTQIFEFDIDTPLPGDGNDDGWVDGLDYLLWAGNFGTHRGADGDPSDGDYNDDGWVDGLDYLLWAGNFGMHAASAVPEPSSLLLVLMAGLVFAGTRRQVQR